MDLYKANKGDLTTSKINVHQGAMAISPSDLVCSTHYQIYEINQTEVNSKYLLLLLRSQKFLEIVNLEKAGGIKNEAGAEFLTKFKIPLPPLEVQNEIVEKIEKQKQIIDGVEKIENSFTIQMIVDFPDTEIVEIGKVCELAYGDPLPEKDRVEGQYPVFGAGNMIGTHNKFLVKGPAIIIGRRGATSGTVMYSDEPCWPIDTAFYVKLKKQGVDLKYVYYALKSLDFFKFQFGGAMPGVKRIEEILAGVWGE